MKAYVVIGKPYVSDDGYGFYHTESSVHHELGEAHKEVDRRARLMPGEDFIVMEAVAISEHTVDPLPVKSLPLRELEESE